VRSGTPSRRAKQTQAVSRIGCRPRSGPDSDLVARQRSIRRFWSLRSRCSMRASVGPYQRVWCSTCRRKKLPAGASNSWIQPVSKVGFTQE